MFGGVNSGLRRVVNVVLMLLWADFVRCFSLALVLVMCIYFTFGCFCRRSLAAC